MKKSNTINNTILDIIQNEFDGCEWFIISASELMKTLNVMIEMAKDKQKSINDFINVVGNIGMDIGKVEKSLDGVEDCYNRLVEVLSDESASLKKRAH